MYDKIFKLQGWKVARPRIQKKVSLYVFILDILSGEISRILSNREIPLTLWFSRTLFMYRQKYRRTFNKSNKEIRV